MLKKNIVRGNDKGGGGDHKDTRGRRAVFVARNNLFI